MKYVIKTVATGPEGHHEGTQYYIAETECEMERFVNTFKNDTYFSVTCVGPVATPALWMQKRIDEHV